MAARDELKRRGFSLELMDELKRDVVARISPWNKLHHAHNEEAEAGRLREFSPALLAKFMV